MCLGFPETHETWGHHPNFRAGRKTFCAFEIVKDRPSIAFRLDPTSVERMLRRPDFFETPYGRGLWVSVWVDSAPWTAYDRLFAESYRTVASKLLVKAFDVRKTSRSRRG